MEEKNLTDKRLKETKTTSINEDQKLKKMPLTELKSSYEAKNLKYLKRMRRINIESKVAVFAMVPLFVFGLFMGNLLSIALTSSLLFASMLTLITEVSLSCRDVARLNKMKRQLDFLTVREAVELARQKAENKIEINDATKEKVDLVLQELRKEKEVLQSEVEMMRENILDVDDDLLNDIEKDTQRIECIEKLEATLEEVANPTEDIFEL